MRPKSRTSRVLVIDCQVAGISGDMLVAALIDLGANESRVLRAIDSIKKHLSGCTRLKSSIKSVKRNGFKAKRLLLDAKDSTQWRSGTILYRAIGECVEDIGLPPNAKEFSKKVTKLLVSAEARLHGENTKTVHLHEAGSVDTIADIIGSTVALHDLGIFEGVDVYATKLAVGGGTIRFSHGQVPSPAPAVMEIVQKTDLVISGGPIEDELTTPTGAAILASLARSSGSHYPSMKIESVGYGAGSKSFPGVPNLLRLVLGKSQEGFLVDEPYVLESNLDDVSGEVIGHSVERLLEEGARDVSVIPVQGKKGRPSQIIQVITNKSNLEMLATTLMIETGTIGVRFHPTQRYMMNRISESVEVVLGNVRGKVRIKMSRDRAGNLVRAKPEYEDLKRLSKRSGIPLRHVADAALKMVKGSTRIQSLGDS